AVGLPVPRPAGQGVDVDLPVTDDTVEGAGAEQPAFAGVVVRWIGLGGGSGRAPGGRLVPIAWWPPLRRPTRRAERLSTYGTTPLWAPSMTTMMMTPYTYVSASALKFNRYGTSMMMKAPTSGPLGDRTPPRMTISGRETVASAVNRPGVTARSW